MFYEILNIDKASIERTEQLGSKPKFWFRKGEESWLFKEARANTGEHWAEKIAAELAHAMNIPAARVELASFEGQLGAACLDFVAAERGEVLVHGNELLAGQVLGYEKSKIQHQSDHTLDNIRSAIQKIFPEEHATTILQTLAKYCIFDAVIGNTDRHHENWGLLFTLELATRTPEITVAPSFDHASSLGRELTDEARLRWLQPGLLQRYIKNGRGGIYMASSDSRGANPLQLARFGALRFPEYFSPGLAIVAKLQVGTIETIIGNIPHSVMSVTAKHFANEFIKASVAELKATRT